MFDRGIRVFSRGLVLALVLTAAFSLPAYAGSFVRITDAYHDKDTGVFVSWETSDDVDSVCVFFSSSKYFVDSWSVTVPNKGEDVFQPYGCDFTGVGALMVRLCGLDEDGNPAAFSDVCQVDSPDGAGTSRIPGLSQGMNLPEW